MLKYLLALVSIILSLAASETIVRSLRLAPEVKRMRIDVERTAYRLSDNPILSYEFKKNYRDSEPDLWQTFPYINSDSQRDIERERKRPGGVYRIAMMGDSVVCGDGILDLNDTLSRQLEKALVGSNPTVEVLNFGVSGYCSLAEIELLRTKALAYSPDMVIVLFVNNDYENHNAFNPFAFPRPNWVNTVFVHSALVRFLSLRMNLFHYRDQMDSSHVVRWHGGAIGPDNVLTAMALLKDLSQKHGFEALVILWPTFEPGGISYQGGQGSLPIEQICAGFGLPVRRIDAEFRADWQNRKVQKIRPDKLYTIGDGMHPSIEGTKIGASAIRAVLEELHIFKQQSAGESSQTKSESI